MNVLSSTYACSLNFGGHTTEFYFATKSLTHLKHFQIWQVSLYMEFYVPVSIHIENYNSIMQHNGDLSRVYPTFSLSHSWDRVQHNHDSEMDKQKRFSSQQQLPQETLYCKVNFSCIHIGS